MSEAIETKGKPGRPAGSRGRAKVPALLDRLMVANKREIKQIIESIIKLAEGGEKWAIEAVAARVWPVPAGRTVTFAMPPLEIRFRLRELSGCFAPSSFAWFHHTRGMCAALDGSEQDRRGAGGEEHRG
jgi:hypothetical protein